MNNFSVTKLCAASSKAAQIGIIAGICFGLIACGKSIDSSDFVDTLDLPLDLELTLECEDEGINTETCILDNPENPFARANINDTTKFDLVGDLPSAKSVYYLWGTALARSAQGENQYYTARALHDMYTQGAGELVQTQAQRAYRAVLDHFFESFTRFLIETPNGDQNIAIPLKDLVGELIYDPIDEGLAPLYNSQLEAQDALSSWGYAFDTDTGVLTSDRP